MRFFRSRPVETEVEAILARNLVLQLLLSGGYRWIGLALVLALGYFALGIIVAIVTNSLTEFLHSRSVYLLLVGVVAIVAYGCWYPRQLVQVLAAIPEAFRIEPQATWKVVERWTRFIHWPIPMAIGVSYACVILWLTWQWDITVVSSQNHPAIWFVVYRNALLAVVCVMTGAVEVFFATIVLLLRLFQFELKLSHYRRLSALSTLTTGLTIGAAIGVAGFILLVFDQVNGASLAVASFGIMGGILMFAIPQFSYQNAVVRAKRSYLNQLGVLYEQYYRVIEKDSIDCKSLQMAKEAIEALQTIEKNIESIPLWLVDVSDASRALLSLLAPIGSLLISTVVSNALP